MADQIVQFKGKEELIEKWIDVIDPKESRADGTKNPWCEKIEGAPKVQGKHYQFMAETLEQLEQLVLNEKTVAGDVAVYNPVLIPLVRRVTPSIIGPEIFGTQPMKQSNGMIFYQRSVYQGPNAYDIKYGTGAQIIVLQNAVATLAVGTALTVGGATATIAHVEGGGSVVLVKGSANTSAGAMVTMGGTALTVSTVYTNEQNFEYILQNYSGPYSTGLNSVGASISDSTYESFDFNTMNELGLMLESDMVVAKKRSLKAKWSRDMEEDLKNAHGINAEQILTQMAGEEIVREMNREFVNSIDGQTTISGVNMFTINYNSLDGRWEGEKYQNLVAHISRTRRLLATRNRRGQATFLICTPLALSILESTGKLSSDGVDPLSTYQAGKFLGMDVYVDFWASDSTPAIWLGYKGSNEIDAGFFYCPYVPLRVDKGTGQDDNLPRLFFSTRYGLVGNKYGADRYYAKLNLTNFPGYARA